MPGEKSLNGRVPASRRTFVKGLGAAGAALSGMAMLPRWSFAEDAATMYASAAIDWKQFSGQTITLMGATHPWSNAITPLLPQFTKFTGIDVVTDFQLETAFLGALPIKLAGGSRTPDVLTRPTSSRPPEPFRCGLTANATPSRLPPRR